jgi:hypothetical protein
MKEKIEVTIVNNNYSTKEKQTILLHAVCHAEISANFFSQTEGAVIIDKKDEEKLNNLLKSLGFQTKLSKIKLIETGQLPPKLRAWLRSGYPTE